MNRNNRNRPPKRRAAPTKIIDNSFISEDDEEDELPHEYEEKILAMIDDSDSSDSSDSNNGVISSCEDEASLKSEEKKVKPSKATSKQTRTFKCISSHFIPKDNAPALEFEEKNCEAGSPISAARIIIEELHSILTELVSGNKKKKSYNFSYFMIIEEGETSKKFGYLATITEEKCLVATHPMKNIVTLSPVTCDQPISEKSIGIGKRIPIPEQKQIINKKLVPSLSTASQHVIGVNSQEPTQPKKSIKK